MHNMVYIGYPANMQSNGFSFVAPTRAFSIYSMQIGEVHWRLTVHHIIDITNNV